MLCGFSCLLDGGRDVDFVDDVRVGLGSCVVCIPWQTVDCRSLHLSERGVRVPTCPYEQPTTG